MSNKNETWWLVNATRKELYDIGICSESSFNWLLSGEPRQIARTVKTPHGVMVYLKDREFCWVWDTMLIPAKTRSLKALNDMGVEKIGLNANGFSIAGLNINVGLDKWGHRKIEGTMLTAVSPLKKEITTNACCEKEKRNINGGCENCGDPSF